MNNTEIKTSVWRRFCRSFNSEEACNCYACPFGSSTSEKNPREKNPNKEDGHCVLCFQDWSQEKGREGRICRKCGEWVDGKKVTLGMVLEGLSDGKRIWVNATCTDCATKFIKKVIDNKKITNGGKNA